MTVYNILPDHDLGGGAVNTARLMRALARVAPDLPCSAMLPADASDSVRRVFADLPHVLADYPGRGAPHLIARAALKLAKPGDILHGQGTRAAMGAGLAAAWNRRLRPVYTVRGFHGLAQPGPLGLRVKLERLMARRMAATIFVSHADRALAEEAGLRFRHRSMVIENGLEVPPADPDAPRDIDLLFVGRMVYQKHPQAFVETLARIEGAPRTIIVGAGEMAAEIDAMLAGKGLDHVTRLDGLPFTETLAHMARARFLVMTSRWEGLPTVAIEAAQSRALVAGMSIPPLAEVLEETGSETLTGHDPASLAARLSALLADEPRRRALADALHDRVRARFAPELMARKYLDQVYRPLGA